MTEQTNLEALAERVEIQITTLKVIREHLEEIEAKIKAIEELAGELNGWASSRSRGHNDYLWRSFRRNYNKSDPRL